MRALCSAALCALAAAQSSIYDTAVASGLTTLVSLLDSSGLAATFQAAGTYTVFAPTDAAFAALPSPLLDWLRNARTLNLATLTSVLEFHALGVVVTSAEVPAPPGSNVTTLCADCAPALAVSNAAGVVTISSTTGTLLATVTTADVQCTNGVVHVIDAVLVPTNQGIPTLDAVQTATSLGFSRLVDFLQFTHLSDTLSMVTDPNAIFTVLMAPNPAFDVLPSTVTTNVTAMYDLLAYNILGGRFYVENLPVDANYTQVTGNPQGQSLTFFRSSVDNSVTVYSADGGVATMTTPDVDSVNAVIHVVSAVAQPAGLPPALPSIYDTAVAAGLSTLVSLLDEANLASTFQNPGNFTVFAPTNAAFLALPAPVVAWLTNARSTNRDALTATLTYHVLGAAVGSSAIPAPPGLAITTLCVDCAPALVASNTAGVVTISSTTGALLATVTTADVFCSNGVVHVIDAVLVPTNKGIPTLDAVQTAVALDFSTLVSLLRATGLNNTLSLAADPSGVFTVFAPTNAAFVSVPASITANATALASVLAYHALAGRVYASDLPAGTNVTATTLNGQTLTLLRSPAAGTLTIYTASGGVSTVTAADVDASNAVLHVVSAVLVPAGMPAGGPASGAAASGAAVAAPVLVALAVAALMVARRE